MLKPMRGGWLSAPSTVAVPKKGTNASASRTPDPIRDMDEWKNALKRMRHGVPMTRGNSMGVGNHGCMLPSRFRGFERYEDDRGTL